MRCGATCGKWMKKRNNIPVTGNGLFHPSKDDFPTLLNEQLRMSNAMLNYQRVSSDQDPWSAGLNKQNDHTQISVGKCRK